MIIRDADQDALTFCGMIISYALCSSISAALAWRGAIKSVAKEESDTMNQLEIQRLKLAQKARRP